MNEVDEELISLGISVNLSHLHEKWSYNVEEILKEANLLLPETGNTIVGGCNGIHSEHLGPLLCGNAVPSTRPSTSHMVSISEEINLEKVWELLAGIPDPDIPVISIVDLGIVREVKLLPEGKVCVTITPSYSGCPAMGVFREDIISQLTAHGANEVQIVVSHAPAWNTDWLSEATKQKMKQYGIAPPEKRSTHEALPFSDKAIKKNLPSLQWKRDPTYKSVWRYPL